MKKFLAILVLGLALIISCNNDTTTEETVVCNECSGLFSEKLDMWVDNEYTQCPSNPEKKCLKVQFNTYQSDTSWVPFDQDICGFDFVPGYVYQLYVERKKIGTDDDGNPIYKYCLLYIKKQTLKPLKK